LVSIKSIYTLAFALILFPLAGQAAKPTRAAGAPAATCEPIILDAIGASEDLSRLTESHSLLSLVNPDPEQNLASLHPAIVMKAAQRLRSLIRRLPTRRTFDANYRIEPQLIYPVFADFIPEAGRRGTAPLKFSARYSGLAT
jgi:hypothetical protein